MTRFNPRAHRGRSARQKAQTRSLPQHHAEYLEKAREIEGGGELLRRTSTPLPLRSGTTTVDKNENKNIYISSLKKGYKNAIQREKRAKLKTHKLQDQADAICDQLIDALSARKAAETALAHLHASAESSNQEILGLQYRVFELEGQINAVSRELLTASNQMEKNQDEIHSLQVRHASMRRSRNALQKKVNRARVKIAANDRSQTESGEEATTSTEYRLKSSSGIIHPEVRDMLRKLACKGVSTEHASEVIGIVAEGLGINIIGSVSARSIARIMLEGLIQARMQIGYDVKHSTSISICSDGTSIKNQQHEARSMFMRLPESNSSNSEPSKDSNNQPWDESNQSTGLRTLGVEIAIGHTAQQQFDGWLNALDICCSTYNQSPLGKESTISLKMVAPKLRGILTDHAADQKRFRQLIHEWKRNCDREARAITVLKKLSTEDQLYALSKYLDSATESIGDWRTLPENQQSAIMHDAWFTLAAQIGESEFQKLTSDSQFDADFLAWAGCCMHKELNSVKGGVSSMSGAWETLKLTPPIALWNKYEVEHKLKTTEEKLMRGAIKLVILTGTLFKNKDEKKGYQKSVDFFFEASFGYSKRFPDTSNTRYGSYCDAAMELILHQKTFIELLETLRDAKGTRKFNNIERNIYEGLTDIPTLTELVILALYGQVIGHPYMIYVRTPGRNALDLGPFHERVKKLCRDISENPNIVLTPDPTGERTTLDEKPWSRPEVVYRALCLAPQLPNLGSLLSAFFSGALESWERFTTEFNQDGLVAQASQEQRNSAWIPPTNDISEGALGEKRQMQRWAPTMTDEQFNARVMWQRNSTYEWAKQTLAEEDELYVRREARIMAASGASRDRRMAVNRALEGRAAEGRAKQAKRDARISSIKQKLAEVPLLEDATYESLLSMKVRDLDNQIDKLREAGDKEVRAKSMITNKRAKIKEILAGYERRKKLEGETGSEKIDLGNSSWESIDTDGNLDLESCPDDVDLYHPGEVVF